MQTVVDQNQTAIATEAAVYRVVEIEWEQLITGLDTISVAADSSYDVRKENNAFFSIC